MRQWFVRDGISVVADTLETSLSYLEGIWHNEGPFHGVLGFSMGGCMTAIMAAMPSRFPGLKFVIIGGAPDLTLALQDMCGGGNIPHTVRSLHLIGLADNVIPPSLSKALACRFHSPIVIEHEQVCAA